MSEDEEEEEEDDESELELLPLRRVGWVLVSTALGFSTVERTNGFKEVGEKNELLTYSGKYLMKEKQEIVNIKDLTFGFCRFLDRVELPADILQPPLQLPPLFQSQLLFRLANAAFLSCCTREDDKRCYRHGVLVVMQCMFGARPY